MADFLLDTNMLLRFCEAASPGFPLAWRAVSNLLEQGENIHITPQNLIEFWAVATRSREVNGLGWDTERTKFEIEHLLGQFPLLEDTPEVFDRWLQLVTSRGTRGKQVHDARLVAVMHAHAVTQLLTFNTGDFKGYPGITLVHPGEV